MGGCWTCGLTGELFLTVSASQPRVLGRVGDRDWGMRHGAFQTVVRAVMTGKQG